MTPQDVINQTNTYRATKGLKPLSNDSSLQNAAEMYAAELGKTNEFSHSLSSGINFQTLVTPNKYVKLGQNLARNYSDATSTMKAWMASAPHDKNLTDSVYTNTGVAVVPGSNTVVQYFGTPHQLAAPKAAPVATGSAKPGILKANSAAPVNLNAMKMK